MEVARLETLYTANVSDLEKKSAQADSRLKKTADQAKQTERAVGNAFKGTRVVDPLDALKAEFGARTSRLKSDLSDIGARSAALRSPLGQLEAQAIKTGAALRKDLDGALGIVSPRLTSVLGAVGPLTAGILGLGAVVAGGAGLFALAKRAADTGDEIFDLTQKVNFSAESISTLKNAGQTAGVEFGLISAALGIFDKNIEAVNQGDKELSRTFKALKIDVRDNESALRSAFRSLIDVKNGSQQTALAMKLFGRSGKDVLGVIKETNGDLDQAIEKYRELGTLITSETARAANNFSDKLTLLEQKFDAVARSVGERFMPIVSDAMDKVNDALDRNKSTARNWATDLVSIVEFAARQVGYILTGMARTIEGFRKTFGKGSLFERISEGGSVSIDQAAPLTARMRAQGMLPQKDPNTPGLRWEDEGEIAVPFGRPKEDKPERINIPGGGGGGSGAKTQRDILEGLKTTLIDLNAEYRKFDVALLDSANSSAWAAEKEKLLSNLMSSVKVSVRQTISELKDVDDAIEQAIGSLPRKSQAAARALVEQSLAQFKQNEAARLGGELSQKAEELLRGWRIEIDNTRLGTDQYSTAIDNLEKAFTKYGETLDAGTKKELMSLATQQRLLRATRERVVVLNQLRQRVAGGDILRDLGEGSFVFRGDAGRERIATIEEQVFRERLEMRRQEMREVADELGEMFGDIFGTIGQEWEDMWSTMKDIALNISRSLVTELVTGVFSRVFNVPFESRAGGIVGMITNGIFNRQQAPITDLGGGSIVVPGGTGSTRPRVAGARAGGGPVEMGKLYRINENHTEYFRPNIGGQVVPIAPQQQQSPQARQETARIYLVDDERTAREMGARQILKISKQMRKVGKLVPI